MRSDYLKLWGVLKMSSDFFDDDFSSAQLSVLMAAKGWQNRYKELLTWSKLVNVKQGIREAENKVQGCSLDTWLVFKRCDGLCYFAVDSDSRVVKGLAVLLLLQVNGKTAKEIAALDFDGLLFQLDLHRHLSPSRNNGFKALRDRVLSLIAE